VPAADPQILLKVRFASVDRSKEKQLGINVFSNRPRQYTLANQHGTVFSPVVNLPASGSAATASAIQ
jgi:Flp pilus assembly secretin CpaC